MGRAWSLIMMVWRASFVTKYEKETKESLFLACVRGVIGGPLERLKGVQTPAAV